MPVRAWDGALYDEISVPQQTWGREVLQRLKLRGDELVLDAGCGSGRVTEMLLSRLPEGRVIAVDADASMVAAARRRLRGRPAEVLCADLLELKLEQRVDAVLSTATFHWIADHNSLYQRLRGLLRDGGQLVAQCGGEGNVARVHAEACAVASQPHFASAFTGWRAPWNFTDPQRAQQSLITAGFRQARCWLAPAPVIPPQPQRFLREVILGPYLQRLSDAEADRFANEVERRLGEPLLIDYVRLNIDAIA